MDQSKMTLFQVILSSVFILIAVKAENNCEGPLTLYSELGCKAIFAEKNTSCPVRYECPFMNRTVDTKKCYYKSKEYGLAEKINDDELEHVCSAECICIPQSKEELGFRCPEHYCTRPSFRQREDDGQLFCIDQYEKNVCCPEEICGLSSIESYAKCEFEGKVYRKGEKFYPKGTCKECICDEQFKHVENSSYCYDINCGIEVLNAKNVHNKCAPIYLESKPCCPIAWKCGNDEKYSIDSANVKNPLNNENKCTYDDKKIDIGARIKFNDECLNCTCVIPPLVTCTKPEKC